MGFFAFVEILPGNLIPVNMANGMPAGKLLESFLLAMSMLSMPKTKSFKEISPWFQPWVGSIPHIDALSNAWYGGDWDYGDDEFEKFLQDAPQGQMTKDDFLQIVGQVREKWTDTHTIYSSVVYLNKYLVSHDLQPSWWYNPIDTQEEFLALESALKQAIDLGVKRIRIKML